MNATNNNLNLILFTGNAIDLLKDIESESIQLIFTSPPYNIGKEYETTLALDFYLEQQDKLISELYRVLKPSGSICWEVGNYVHKGEIYPLDILFYDLFKSFDLHLRNRIIWRFGHGLHCSRRFSGRYETILWFTKSDNYTFNLDPVRVPSKYPNKKHFKGSKKGQLSGNPLGKNPSDIWNILLQDWEQEVWDIPNVKNNHPEKTDHPCQFPIELAERLVLALSNENDIVLDPYMGAGSTLLAGLKNNRKVIGSDKEPKYVDITRERINSFYNGTLGYRQLGTPIYQPKKNG